MMLLTALVAVGTLLSGIAAVGQLVTRWHLRKLRTEVNGQSHVLVETAHQLGVSEGVLQQIATPIPRTNGGN